jgi:hypothetical protein
MRKTPVVLGVLSMVFGGLVIVWSGFSMLSQRWSRDVMQDMKLPHRAGQPDPALLMKRMAEETDKLAPILYTESGGMIALSLVLIVVGIGLYRRQGWARRAALIWAAAAIAFLPVRIYLQTSIVLPRIQAATHEVWSTSGLPSTMMDSISSMQGVMTSVGLIVFYAPFPIILLLLMGRSSAKNDLYA